eukprot:Rmarinus@m.28424
MSPDSKSLLFLAVGVTGIVGVQCAVNYFQRRQFEKEKDAINKRVEALNVQLNDARREVVMASSSRPPSPTGSEIDIITAPNTPKKKKTSTYRIVLTGGPCAGKTTAMTKIQDRLTSLGFRVFKVAEAATLLMSGGATPHNLVGEQALVFQTHLLKIQMVLEDAYYAYAQSTCERSVVICDRGAMDGSAYMEKSQWQALLDENDWTTVNLRDKRYDAVIHLVTAANGAVKFYHNENNATRYEDVEDAIATDNRLQDAWVGHPHFRVIDNSTDFETKIQRVIESICSFVDLPTPVGIQKKYLVDLEKSNLKALARQVKLESFGVRETFLITTDGTEAKVRRRGQNGSYTYVHSVRRFIDDQRVELKRPINGRIYVSLLSQADAEREPVEKRRRCFLYSNHYFILDEFLNPSCKGLVMLRTEVERIDQDISFPDHIHVTKEVTGDKRYSSYVLAEKTTTPPQE